MLSLNVLLEQVTYRGGQPILDRNGESPDSTKVNRPEHNIHGAAKELRYNESYLVGQIFCLCGLLRKL